MNLLWKRSQILTPWRQMMGARCSRAARSHVVLNKIQNGGRWFKLDSTRPNYDVSMNLFCWPPSVDIFNILPGFLWQPLLTCSKFFKGFRRLPTLNVTPRPILHIGRLKALQLFKYFYKDCENDAFQCYSSNNSPICKITSFLHTQKLFSVNVTSLKHAYI